MHLSEDPLGPKNWKGTNISAAKVSSTLGDRYKSRGDAEVEAMNNVKSKTLRQRITEKMPAWKKTVDNLANPASAASKVMRATAAKGGSSKEQIKSYRY